MTMLTVVQKFCRRTGLPVPSTVYGSTDTKVLQIMGILEEEVNDLAVAGGWQELQCEAAHTTIASRTRHSAKMCLAAPHRPTRQRSSDGTRAPDVATVWPQSGDGSHP